MRRNREKTSKKVKTPPGTLQHVGEIREEDVKITLIEYNQETYSLQHVTKVRDIAFTQEESVKWINVVGLKDVQIIKDLGKRFNLHPLLLEDVLNTSLNPKIQGFGEYVFMLVNLLQYNQMKNEIVTEQISFVLFKDMLITFQEFSGEIFDSVIQRIEGGMSIKSKAEDYLFYSLLDAAVDNYFIVLEQVADKMDLLEDQIIDQPDKEALQEIYELKREMIYVRNSIRPLRDMVSQLTYNELGFINQQTIYYIRDIHDHIIQIIDTNDTYRDILSGMLDIYFSSIGSKTNDVMKVLTIFSTIFIPLTFLAGIYGMNFTYMPELSWRYAYPVFWIISIGLSVGMIRFFQKKKWL